MSRSRIMLFALLFAVPTLAIVGSLLLPKEAPLDERYQDYAHTVEVTWSEGISVYNTDNVGRIYAFPDITPLETGSWQLGVFQFENNSPFDVTVNTYHQGYLSETHLLKANSGNTLEINLLD